MVPSLVKLLATVRVVAVSVTPCPMLKTALEELTSPPSIKLVPAPVLIVP